MFLSGTVIAIGIASLLALGGTLFAIGADEAEEQKKANAQANIDLLNASIASYESFKSEVVSYVIVSDEAISALEQARKLFKDGGHVTYGVPLANDRISSCVSSVEKTKQHLNDTITNIDNEIASLRTQIAENQKIIDG